MRRYSLTLVFLGFFAVIPPLAAEDPSRGRLADGRAYRVDESGNEIVDYIAELELQVDALKRQVHGLEYELEQKQQVAARAERGAPGTVTERTLIQPKKSDSFALENASPRGRLESGTSELNERLAEAEARHQDEKAKLESEIALLQRNLRARLDKAPITDPELQSLRSMLDERDLQIASLQARLAEDKGADELTANKLKVANEQLASALAERDRKIAELSERLEVNKQVAERKLAMVQSEAQRARDLEDSVKGTALASESKLPTLSSRAGGLARAEANRDRALESIKGRMITQLNRVRGKAATRESFFNQYRSQGRRVTFKLSPLHATSGRSLNEVGERIRSSTSISELSALHRDLAEIESKIKDDIALIERLSKAR